MKLNMQTVDVKVDNRLVKCDMTAEMVQDIRAQTGFSFTDEWIEDYIRQQEILKRREKIEKLKNNINEIK